MGKLLIIICITCVIFPVNSMAESKMSVDLSIDKLDFKRPQKGVGQAGILVFKSANVVNNGTVLSINNIKNLFDSQIFVRPTFLGFTTQFGNYGFPIELNSIINAVDKTELQNSKFILDDNQLNLSGDYFSFINGNTNLKLQNFRLYCQNILQPATYENPIDAPANDMIKNCFSFLTLNGNNVATKYALIEFEGNNQTTGDKSFFSATVNSFDLRKNQINVNLINAKSVSNDSYFMNMSELNLNCAKDEDLQEVNFEKIKKACLNQIKVAPLKINISDKKSKTSFNLDIKDITIKDQLAYFSLNSGALSDAQSTTYLDKLLLNCKKETDTDLFDLHQVLKDCLTYARFSLAEVKTSKPDDKKNSSIKNIIVNSTNGNLLTHVEAKYLGLTAKVTITGRAVFDQSKNQLSLTITDAKLPLGIHSVKLFMYFLKKMVISKTIDIENNVITISL